MNKYLMTILFAVASNLYAAAWTGATSEPESMKKIDGKPFYVISNADELAWVAAKVNAGEKTINAVLANDIVFGADTATTSKTTWNEIKEYGGILDGNGYSIYGLYFKNDWHGPSGNKFFINSLSKSGKIANLKIRSFNGDHMWGFVYTNNGSIINVHNFSDVHRRNFSDLDDFIGSIAYRNNGIVRGCSNNGKVTFSWGGSGQTLIMGGIVGINSGTVDSCINNNGSLSFSSDFTTNRIGGIVGTNKGKILYCVNNVSIQDNNRYGGESSGITYDNQGEISYCIQKYKTNYSISEKNTGTIKSTIDISTNSYYSNNKKIQLTAESMKSDLTAWKLNTLDGTATNSGVWTRGTNGYPTFANKDSLAIRKVVFNDDGTTSNRYTNYKGLVTFPEDPEPAEGYIFSGWYNSEDTKVKPTTVFTADQAVNAVYMDASDVYWTINFYNAAPADTILETKSYQHGSIVTYGGVEPTLSATAKYTYTFKGWDVEPTNAIEDFNYHALYDSTIRSYKISFNNYDGELIENATFEYGKTPNCSKAPTREATAEWKFTHKGWKPALDYVTEEATYTAIYDSTKVEYKVTFMNGTEIIDEQMIPYGDAAVAPTNVTREGYKFVGWNTSFAKVTTALTIKALFEELIIRTINVVNNDGEKIDSAKVEDGKTYTLPDAPKKDGYTFDAYYDGNKKLGVAGDEISITANITITAKYIKNPESSSSSKEIASSSSSSSAKVSSSSTAKSSSSSIKSSSSSKTNVIAIMNAPQFSVQVVARNLQISGTKIGATYTLFDMQGRILQSGRIKGENFNIVLPQSGSFLIQVGDQIRKVNVK